MKMSCMILEEYNDDSVSMPVLNFFFIISTRSARICKPQAA